MALNKTILKKVDEKTKDNKKQNGGRKQTTSARRSDRKKKNKDLPRWIYVISATCLSFVFIIGSYYLFFQAIFLPFPSVLQPQIL